MDSNHQSAIPLVLIHAFPLSSAMWHPQRDAFGQRLVTPDMPGFGGEPGLDEEGLTMERMAMHLARLLDARGIDRCILGGVSMGGYITFACLRTIRDRIAGLVLADTRATADSETARKGREAAMERIGAGDYEAYCETLLHKLLAERTRRDNPDLVDSVRRMMRETHPETASAALLGMLARPNSSDLLSSIDVPTAVIVGEHDAITTVEEAREMSSAIRDASLHVIPDAGHLSNIENPDAFNAAVSELMSRVPAAAGATA